MHVLERGVASFRLDAAEEQTPHRAFHDQRYRQPQQESRTDQKHIPGGQRVDMHGYFVKPGSVAGNVDFRLVKGPPSGGASPILILFLRPRP
jgi:hypothetical protein